VKPLLPDAYITPLACGLGKPRRLQNTQT
jgi:hypothetical protein